MQHCLTINFGDGSTSQSSSIKPFKGAIFRHLQLLWQHTVHPYEWRWEEQKCALYFPKSCIHYTAKNKKNRSYDVILHYTILLNHFILLFLLNSVEGKWKCTCLFIYYFFLLPCEPPCCRTDLIPVPSSDWLVPSGSWLHQRTSQSAAEEAPQCPVLTGPRFTEDTFNRSN